MHAYIFPGQGAQFPGMGKEVYEASSEAKSLFEEANDILGFSITNIMFGEDAEALKQTQVTQPAIFLHSVILSQVMGERFRPDAVAGHSLGEFSALVAAKALSFRRWVEIGSSTRFSNASCLRSNSRNYGCCPWVRRSNH